MSQTEVEHDMRVIDAAGLFDRVWYTRTYPDVGGEPDALAHYCLSGWRHGLCPNPYFDTAWYARTYAAELAPDQNPALHYIERGERENAWPSAHFDPEWYRDHYEIGDESPLRHYLSHRVTGRCSPLPSFDAAEYLAANPGCLDGGLDAYQHSIEHRVRVTGAPPRAASPLAAIVDAVGGNLEAGIFPETITWDAFSRALRPFIPFIPFDEQWYRKTYPDVDKAVRNFTMSSAHEHFVSYGFFEGRTPAPPAGQSGD